MTVLLCHSDLKSKSPSPMEADFKTVLTIVGWLLLGVVILMFLGLMAVHLLIPRLARRDTAVSSSGSATCMFWNFPAWIRRMSSRVRNQPDQPRPPGDQQHRTSSLLEKLLPGLHQLRADRTRPWTGAETTPWSPPPCR
ncbi:uncharacterized protein LOC143289331 [Babylonia areolata]|uniref:uncharacterized protein LOC143289331 n=1 Tax=Babylonia areolata TaxID=304850 RepID=UPI003FD3D675